MGRRTLTIVLAALFAGGTAGTASATIHPLMVGWVCGKATGNPPGQTPGETHADQSTFRALLATGVVVGEQDGLPIFDLENPAIKFSSFMVFPEETGVPSNQGALNCSKGILTD